MESEGFENMRDTTFRHSNDLYRSILECLAAPERAALATVLTAFTIVSLLIFMKFSKSKEITF
jgi:hypothetical protein